MGNPILDLLGDAWTTGRELRARLNYGVPWWAFWRRWSGPAMYAALARLEDAGLAEGRERWEMAGPEMVRGREYRRS